MAQTVIRLAETASEHGGGVNPWIVGGGTFLLLLLLLALVVVFGGGREHS